MASFTAQYHGECPSCGEDLKGTEATYDSSGEVVHVKCPRQKPLPELCTKCWTHHNGECL